VTYLPGIRRQREIFSSISCFSRIWKKRGEISKPEAPVNINTLTENHEKRFAIYQFCIDNEIKLLAAALRSCDSKELPGVLQVVCGIFAGNPEARRDFFINKLLLPCLNEAHAEISKNEAEFNAKIFVEKDEKFLKINHFCLDNGMELSVTEEKKAGSLCNKVTEFLAAEKIRDVMLETMGYAITSSG
jgi:hypothetical protein